MPGIPDEFGWSLRLVLGVFDRGISAQLSAWLRSIGSSLGIPILATIDLSQSRLLIFGLALVILMVSRPEGLFPSARRVNFWKLIFSPARWSTEQ